MIWGGCRRGFFVVSGARSTQNAQVTAIPLEEVHMVLRFDSTAFLRFLLVAVSVFALALGCSDKPRGDGNDTDEDDSVSGLPLASGIQMTAIELYQGVQIPIMSGGESVLDNDVPIVAGKDAVIRVYVELAEGFEARALWLRAELTNSAGTKHLEEQNEVSVNSTAGSIGSTLNLKIPGAELEVGQAISLSIRELSEDAAGSGSTDGAIWPASGGKDLGLGEVMVPMKLVLVPVEYNADGSGRLPDTSATQIQLYKDLFYAMYPVSGVEITVDDPMPYSGNVSAMGGGWDSMLNAVTQRRTDNGAGSEEFYYGIVSPANDFGAYCNMGCVTGMSWLAEAPGSMQVGTGIGFTGADSVNTAVHEVGHTYGLNHAPCGGAQGPDPNFPYAGGGIGVMGYDVTMEYSQNPLKDPNNFKDLMGYCSPNWVSDYNFDLMFDRVDAINDYLGAGISPPPDASTTWLSVLVRADGTAETGPTLDSALPFEGEIRTIVLLDAEGAAVGEVEGVFVPHADLGGGLVVFREPGFETVAAQVVGYPAVDVR
jgi:hypothetical protein